MKRIVLCVFFLITMLSSPLFSQIAGDANSDGQADVIDALLTAQYYVGLDPQGIDLSVMDVNGDYSIDIIDALLIAQYYVGLIPSLSMTPGPPTNVPTYTPVPTLEPTPSPIPTPPLIRTINFWYKQTGTVYTETVSIPNNTATAFDLFTAELWPAEVMGFGSNSFNVLGLDVDSDDWRNFPLSVPIFDVEEMVVALFVSFFLRQDGSLWGCGYNLTGALGDGTDINKPYPVELLRRCVKKVSTGGVHTLILKTDGSLWVCGTNKNNALGYDSPTDFVLTPYQLMSSGVVDIATGSNYSLAVRTDGSLWVWGWNNYGELGTGNSSVHEVYPVQVIDSEVVAVSACSSDTSISLALKRDGSLWAAGEGVLYDEGTGTYTNSNTFTRVLDSGVIKAVTGNNQILTIMNNGALWGYRFESLSAIPGAVLETEYPGWVIIDTGDVVDIAASLVTSFWIKTNGSLWGCGSNTVGQLAQQEWENYILPVQIYASCVQKVAAGPLHTLVLRPAEASAFSHTATLPVTVPSGQSYDFTVLFNAFEEGDYGGILTVTTSDPDNPVINFSLTGSSRIIPPEPTPEMTPGVTGLP